MLFREKILYQVGPEMSPKNNTSNSTETNSTNDNGGARMPDNQNKPPEKLTEEEIKETVTPNDPISNQMDTKHQSEETKKKIEEQSHLKEILFGEKFNDIWDGILKILKSKSSIDVEQSDTVDDWMEDAEDFIQSGENQNTINQGELQKVSDTLYNLFLAVGIIAAILVGILLGIKYMLGSIEEQAELKEMSIAYVVGCIVIFGAFGIWKLVIEIFSGI